MSGIRQDVVFNAVAVAGSGTASTAWIPALGMRKDVSLFVSVTGAGSAVKITCQTSPTGTDAEAYTPQTGEVVIASVAHGEKKHAVVQVPVTGYIKFVALELNGAAVSALNATRAAQ